MDNDNTATSPAPNHNVRLLTKFIAVLNAHLDAARNNAQSAVERIDDGDNTESVRHEGRVEAYEEIQRLLATVRPLFEE